MTMREILRKKKAMYARKLRDLPEDQRMMALNLEFRLKDLLEKGADLIYVVSEGDLEGVPEDAAVAVALFLEDLCEVAYKTMKGDLEKEVSDAVN